MSQNRYTHLTSEIREAIANPKKSQALYTAMKRGRDNRAERLENLKGGLAFREEVKDRKNHCKSCSEDLMEKFIANAEKRGVKVFIAKTGADAIAYTLKLAEEKQAKTVSKSKSLTTEEIEINDPLLEAGLRVVETDLGELIIQLAGEKPYHLVFPSVHKTAVEVAEIFEKETGKPVPNDIDAIMKIVRNYLRPIFLNTDIGMTGANVGIAETGGIVIETNEGNARLVSSIGNCHICIMGMEKIVETIDDALLMVLAHPVSATGQLPTTYVTWMHGRSPMGEGEGPLRDSHIIILDNGRTEMKNDPALEEALNCIRCGACMNICPTYGVVGGHTFGYIYPGPIGIPWTAQVHGQDLAADFASLCISCGLCKEICPAQIDMPMMIAEIKHRDKKKNPTPKAEATMMAADRFAKLGSATAPLSNWALSLPPARWVMEQVLGLDRHRKLPTFAHNTLEKQWKKRAKQPASNDGTRVAFFADVYANINDPKLGMAIIERLEKAGCSVVYPEQTSSGYPYVAYGDLDKARETALYNIERLYPLAKDGVLITSPEPTAAYALKHTYQSLLPDDERAKVIAQQTREVFELLLELEPSPTTPSLKGKKLGFHCSCHQRPMGSGSQAVEWLQRQGAEVVRVETGTCCGMGGTFGLKAGALGYELSQAVGGPLFQAFAESGVDMIISESSVCAIQLAEGTGLPVVHPLNLLNP
ncbi:MAG: hypothetical protein COA73_14770 [Candidatus Hydrogenedentota bacterium]|nr:MAG: hypothetical protein COA73_14770 [Candidatus Hydrogenedentota bacterium]